MEEVVNDLTEKVNALELSLAEETDCAMRASISIHNLPKNNNEKTWDDTARATSTGRRNVSSEFYDSP